MDAGKNSRMEGSIVEYAACQRGQATLPDLELIEGLF